MRRGNRGFKRGGRKVHRINYIMPGRGGFRL